MGWTSSGRSVGQFRAIAKVSCGEMGLNPGALDTRCAPDSENRKCKNEEEEEECRKPGKE